MPEIKGTCKDCKHWKGEREEIHKSNIHQCTKPIMLWDAAEWEGLPNNDYGRVLLDKYKSHKMFVQDGSDYKAYLFTTEDFACIHFEEITDGDA